MSSCRQSVSQEQDSSSEDEISRQAASVVVSLQAIAGIPCRAPVATREYVASSIKSSEGPSAPSATGRVDSSSASIKLTWKDRLLRDDGNAMVKLDGAQIKVSFSSEGKTRHEGIRAFSYRRARTVPNLILHRDT
jgi:hypothetical protein